MDATKTSCKLCLGTISNENFKIIEEIIKEVFDVLQLKLNEQQNNTSVICDGCSKKLFAAFNFKATCMDTEDCIFPYVHSESRTPVDLREVYLKERGKEHLKDLLEDERICRLCMQVVTYEYTSVKEMSIDTLHTYIPEVDFSSTEDPVVCRVCLDSLDTHLKFLSSCLNVEEEFKNISDYKLAESPFSIITEEIDIKSEENYTDTSLSSTDEALDITNGCQSTTNNSMPKQKKKQQRQNLKNRPSKHIVDRKTYECNTCAFKTIYRKTMAKHQLKHRNIPEDQKYKCDLCDFKTIYKNNLKKHQLVHKDVSEKQTYKCKMCDNKFIYKLSLVRHQKKHKNRSEQQKMYECVSCNYKTVHKAALTTHTRQRHS